MERVKITAKGQITLPKVLRDTLGLREGDYLEAGLRGNEMVLRPLPRQGGKEMLLDYCRRHAAGRLTLSEARRVLARVPFSLAERVRAGREER
ncbi:MAG: AbrB/MazE/SpoVT family DNA-binding domain-containing protein [Bacillota bacterium]|nr:AbrB/MazE/SpoVT family DNA-binding domain-containing protein [Bacillota bacterium]